MRMQRSTALGTTVSLLLIGVGGAVFYLTPPSSLDLQFRATSGMVQRMYQLASKWAVESSRVLADPASNFDSLSVFVPQVRELRSAFTESMASLPVSPQAAADARAYVAALDALGERVERFKTAYSAIRNSERYLPLASDELVKLALGAGDEPFVREIRSVTGAIAEYIAAPSDTDARKLVTRVQLLSGHEFGDPAPNELLQGYVAHARVILAERGRLEAHLASIASNEIAQRAAPLTAALETGLIAHRDRTSLYRWGTLAAGAGVLIVWMIVGFVRRRTPREPNLAHKREHVRRRLPAADITEARAPDVVEAMIGCGALPGMMGQTLFGYARRLLADFDSVCPAGEGAARPEWARMRANIRLLVFLSQRMTVLGRSLAPKHLVDVDVNALLAKRLAERAVAPTYLSHPVPCIKAPQAEVDLLVNACIEWALHGLQGLAPHDAELVVTARPREAGVVVAVTHNGAGPLLEREHAAFIPFAISRSPRAGLALPTVRYLARRLGGTASLTALSDGRFRLTAQLPAGPDA